MLKKLLSQHSSTGQLWLTMLVFMILLGSCNEKSPEPRVSELKVMTFNVLYSTSIEGALDVIQQTGADIIGLQELSKTKGEELANTLDYYYLNFSKSTANLSDNDTGILSRYPIVEGFSNGAIIEIDKDLKVAVFSVHLSPYPYEPYDFRDLVISTAEEAVQSATDTRIPEISPVLLEIDALFSRDIPIFLLGDFNEPSHLDWTLKAANAGLHFEKVVTWPVSSAIINKDLIDSYREIHDNEVAEQGITWTPWQSPTEIHDRIDMIYYHEAQIVEVTESQRIGGVADDAPIRIEGYSSDHYAVLSVFSVK